MNYLNAVFWDYPELTFDENLKRYILENKNSQGYLWVLKRFLEYGRVVDTIKYFNKAEISAFLPTLKLTPYARKKWKRIMEVYGISDRK